MPLVCFTLILSLFPHGSASPISYDNTSPATVNAPKCCWSAYGDKSTCGGYPTGGSGGLCNNDFLVKCNGDANCKNVPPAPPPSPAPTPAPPKPAPPTPPALGPPSPPTPPAPPSPGDALCCWSAWTKPNASDCATYPSDEKGGWCKPNFTRSCIGDGDCAGPDPRPLQRPLLHCPHHQRLHRPHHLRHLHHLHHQDRRLK